MIGTWRLLVEAGWRAWSVDLRGHGDSAWSPEGNYSFQHSAEDVEAVVRSMSHGPVALVGASMGGLASLMASKPLGDRVAALRSPGPITAFADDRLAAMKEALTPVLIPRRYLMYSGYPLRILPDPGTAFRRVPPGSPYPRLTAGAGPLTAPEN